MQMRRIKILINLVLLLVVKQALAVPVGIETKNVYTRFSVDMQKVFHLFGDSFDDTQVWYVPKLGNIQVAGNRPNFNVSGFRYGEGLFYQQQGVAISGRFFTGGVAGDVARLAAEAESLGLRISPAVASRAQTRFLLTGFELGNDGRLRTECEVQIWQGPSGPVEVPVCRALNLQGEWQALDFLYAFEADVPQGGEVVAQSMPFYGVTMPGWYDTIDYLLQTGSSWDAQIQAVTQWSLLTLNEVPQARVTLDWRRFMTTLLPKVEAMRWQLLPGDMQGVLMEVINQDESGVVILYRHPDGRYSEIPADLSQPFVVLNALVERLSKELFVAVRGGYLSRDDLLKSRDPYTLPDNSLIVRAPCAPDFPQACTQPPVLPPILSHLYYVLRANYYRLLQRPVETWEIASNVVDLVHASTYMSIDCMFGSIGSAIWLNPTAACETYAEP